MKTSRLSFKGDSKPYRRKQIKESETFIKEESVSGWIKAKTHSLKGPCLLIATLPWGNAALAVDPQFRLYWAPLDSSAIEPSQVNQVFVAKSAFDAKKILIKSCFDRHLGTDNAGIIECEKEAAGMNHQWELLLCENETFGLLSDYGNFLSIEFPQDSSDSFKKAQVKAIKKSLDSSCKFSIYVQASSLINTDTSKSEFDWVDIESEKLKTSHGHMIGKVKLTKEFGSGLSNAIKKGNVNETLLERRSKMKRDKVYDFSTH